MYKIIESRRLARDISLLEIHAPEIAKNARAGQFIIIRVDEVGERIPLTIYDWSVEKESVSIVFLEVGVSTKKLGNLRKGDYVLDFVGPLGKPFPIKKYGKVACVGGGVGVPAIFPIARALREAGNEVKSIIGARHKDLLILDDEMGSVSNEKLVCTDDGSCGTKGFVTNVLDELVGELDLVIAVGPVPMMSAVSELTRDKVATIVSLNPIMVDGTGMCGACRVLVDGRVKFACVDGPDFDAHKIDFENLATRNRQYTEMESHSVKCWENENAKI